MGTKRQAAALRQASAKLTVGSTDSEAPVRSANAMANRTGWRKWIEMMASIVRVKGIKRYRHPETAVWYSYHRNICTRLKSEFGSPEFFAELAEIEKASKSSEPLPGTLAHVVRSYRNSPGWAALRPGKTARLKLRTRFDCAETSRQHAAAQVDRPFYFASVMKDLAEARPLDGELCRDCDAPCWGSPMIAAGSTRTHLPIASKRRRSCATSVRPIGHGAWRNVEIVLERAPPQLALPIALAMFSGLRKADVSSAI